MSYQADVWRALGVETELAERLVDLQLRWDPIDGKLKVSIRHKDSPSVAAEILSLIQATLRLRALTDSRWIGLGPSSRTLVTATLLGLED